MRHVLTFELHIKNTLYVHTSNMTFVSVVNMYKEQ